MSQHNHKSTKLYGKCWLHIHSDTQATLTHTDSTGKIIDEATYPLTNLPQAQPPQPPIHVLIPASKVSFFDIDRSKIPKKNQATALAYMLEEKLAQNADKAHVVITDQDSKQAMVVDRCYMAHLHELLHSQHYRIQQIIPESLALQGEQNQLYLDATTAILRGPNVGALTCQPSQLGTWLTTVTSTLQTSNIQVYYSDRQHLNILPKPLHNKAQQVSAHWLIEQAHTVPSSLCQDSFAVSEDAQAGTASKAFWWVFAACLISMTCYILTPWWSLHALHRNQHREIAQLIASKNLNLDPTASLSDWKKSVREDNISKPLTHINSLNEQFNSAIEAIVYHQSEHSITITFANISNSEQDKWQQALQQPQNHWRHVNGKWQFTWDLHT